MTEKAWASAARICEDRGNRGLPIDRRHRGRRLAAGARAAGEPAHPADGHDRRRACRPGQLLSPRASSSAGAIELLWPLLRNQSAVEPERVSETLRQSSFWQGRGGAVEHAISGIDIALWDLMGKACGQPVSRLLGGNYRRQDQAIRVDTLR